MRLSTKAGRWENAAFRLLTLYYREGLPFRTRLRTWKAYIYALHVSEGRPDK